MRSLKKSICSVLKKVTDTFFKKGVCHLFLRFANASGQNMLEYLLVFGVILVLIVGALAPRGILTQGINRTLATAFGSVACSQTAGQPCGGDACHSAGVINCMGECEGGGEPLPTGTFCGENNVCNDQSECVCVRVDGGWSDWSPLSECVGCLATRSRSCTNPEPFCGGVDCSGEAMETMSCGDTDGQWVWPDPLVWDECSISPEACTQSAAQVCIDPTPGCSEDDCDSALREQDQQQACGVVIPGVWGDWTEWSTCVNNTQTRMHLCAQPAQCGGSGCILDVIEDQVCESCDTPSTYTYVREGALAATLWRETQNADGTKNIQWTVSGSFLSNVPGTTNQVTACFNSCYTARRMGFQCNNPEYSIYLFYRHSDGRIFQIFQRYAGRTNPPVPCTTSSANAILSNPSTACY